MQSRVVVILPGLFVDRPITLTPQIAALIAVPVVLCILTAYNWRDRHALSQIVQVQLRKDGMG